MFVTCIEGGCSNKILPQTFLDTIKNYTEETGRKCNITSKYMCADTATDTATDMATDRHSDRHIHAETDMATDRRTRRQTDRRTDGHGDRQTWRQTDGQDRQT